MADEHVDAPLHPVLHSRLTLVGSHRLELHHRHPEFVPRMSSIRPVMPLAPVSVAHTSTRRPSIHSAATGSMSALSFG